MRHLFTVGLAFLIAGCATYSPSIPVGYVGPRAQLEDSAKTFGSSKADFFVVEEIDGLKVDNSLNETLRRNQGRGMSMTTYIFSRPLIAGKSIKIMVKGRTHYAAPIQALMNTVFEVNGLVEFTPMPNGRYVIRGELSDNYSAVWVEDEVTNELMGKKVEVNGSAKLGILEK